MKTLWLELLICFIAIGGCILTVNKVPVGGETHLFFITLLTLGIGWLMRGIYDEYKTES